MPRGNGSNGKAKAGRSGLGKFMPNGAGGAAYHGAADKADWSSIHPDLLAAAVVAADRSGGALLFGADRQQTQFAVTVFYSGDKNTFYWLRTGDGAAQLESWLEAFISELNSPNDGLEGG